MLFWEWGGAGADLGWIGTENAYLRTWFLAQKAEAAEPIGMWTEFE